MLKPEISEFLSDFKPKTHAIVFYDNQDNKHDLLFNHLKFGAENNQGLAYVCSEQRPLEIQKEMKEFGLDVDTLRARNRLLINNYDRIYIVNQEVNIPTIMGAFSDLSKKYVSMGLDGMRAAAEMSCFFKEKKVKELIDYENALHRKLAFPAEGLCAYNIFDLVRSGKLGMIMSLVRAHDPVILAGPTGGLILEPDRVEPGEIEAAMQICV